MIASVPARMLRRVTIGGVAAALVSACMSLVLASPAGAQDDGTNIHVIDLATAPRRDSSVVTPGRHAFALTNRLPTREYSVRVEKRYVEIPGIDPSVLQPALLPDTGKAPTPPCTTLVEAVEALRAATAEGDVPDLLRDYAAARPAAEPADARCAALRQAGDALRDGTRARVAATHPLSGGETLIVTVTRHGEDGAAERQWTAVFTTGAPGEWRVSYGYAFPFLSGVAKGGLFSDEARYVTEEAGDKFVIRRQRRTREVDAVPSVFFTFARPGERGLTWQMLTAGLGVDLTDPAVMIGTGITYNANLSLSGGLAARREAVLLGRYRSGDTVATTLTDEQLTERAFKVRPYVSITIRFTSNPFKSDKKDDTAEPDTSGKQQEPAKPEEPETAEEAAASTVRPTRAAHRVRSSG